ncbi:hypothetical protein ACQEU3_37065 [Spirillospora sp. CA-253888]
MVGTGPHGPAWHAAWSAALDALEADVAATEALLADDHRLRDLPPISPWSPPPGLGLLPLDLRPRADAILTRQLAAAQAIATALAANRRQAAVLARIETGGDGGARPTYLNCAA